MRGQQTITSIFPPAFEPDPKNKGKKSIYLEDRDVFICYRFYYYYHLARKRFDDAIADMEKDVFLSGTTIIVYITKNDELLKEIKFNEPSNHDLKKRYPNFNWS